VRVVGPISCLPVNWRNIAITLIDWILANKRRNLVLTPDSDSYLLGMQKQRLLASGSVTANSRSPHV
jgi:hypothetical protein